MFQVFNLFHLDTNLFRTILFKETRNHFDLEKIVYLGAIETFRRNFKTMQIRFFYFSSNSPIFCFVAISSFVIFNCTRKNLIKLFCLMDN